MWNNETAGGGGKKMRQEEEEGGVEGGGKERSFFWPPDTDTCLLYLILLRTLPPGISMYIVGCHCWTFLTVGFVGGAYAQVSGRSSSTLFRPLLFFSHCNVVTKGWGRVRHHRWWWWGGSLDRNIYKHTHTNCTVNVDSAHSLTPKATILVSMIQERLKDKCVTCVNLSS